MKTSELTGAALDWAVAKCEGATNLRFDTVDCWWFTLDGKDRVLSRGWSAAQNFAPSTDWAQGGPIIDRDLLMIEPVFWTVEGWHWVAYVLGPGNLDENYEQRGPTPLIAAMRCYVASKLGDTVEIPEGLT